VDKLSDAFKQVLAMPDVRNRMVSQGADPAFLGAEDFTKFIAGELPKWATAVQKSGARID
jgi:tripartite-type tricarboxylate transporter receptor subunit TctC